MFPSCDMTSQNVMRAKEWKDRIGGPQKGWREWGRSTVTEEPKRLRMQEMAKGFSLLEEALLAF